jgi:hypothetical protein
MSTQVNPTLNVAEDLFKSILWDTTLDVALAALFTEVSFLNVWPIKPIITDLAHMISNAFYSKLRLAVDMAAVPFINAERKKAFESATVTTKLIGLDKGVESPEYKKAKENARKLFIAYSQFNG